MTELSARPFSVSERYPVRRQAGRWFLDERDIHVWRSSREQVSSSDAFKRRVLSRYAEVAPEDWQFGVGKQGKPYLLDAPCALDFNVSHSGEWLVCAVTAGTPVGVDVEEAKSTRDVMTLAQRFFREEEVAALAACRAAEQCDRFYDLWTLKEAAVKARGEQLLFGLDSRGFALAPPAGIALTTPGDGTTAQYLLLDLLPGYRLAICWLPETQLQAKLQVFDCCDSGAVRAQQPPLRARTPQD
ncbi:4'-phosphopantetheinyl transferase Sfp [Halioglobus japonicus]|nr:4'-phosphopantetheinyl transferase Sfp [Halioglobus japonicus]